MTTLARRFRRWLRRRVEIPLPPEESHHEWCECGDCLAFYRFHCRRCKRSLTFAESFFDLCPQCTVDEGISQP